MSGQRPSICYRRPLCRLKAPLGLSLLRCADAVPPKTLLKTDEEELCQIDTIPPASAEASVRKQIAERNNVSESYVVRSEKFMRGVEIMEQMVPGMQEKILSGQFKVRDADMVEQMFNGGATAKGALIITPEKVIVTTPGADNKKEL